ncbi:MAG TPA: hypothetical protein VG324_10135 [Blastocatellia bacterium]|nr:hypothetical protein [Blastocatellia bacterium]
MADGRTWFVVVIIVLYAFELVTGILPLLRNKIVIDDQTISGRINKEHFRLRWREVVAVWDSMTQNGPCLNIGAPDRKVAIPLKFFNEKLLRDLISLHVAPEAFGKDAIKRMPGYHVRNAANERIIEQAAGESLRAGGKAFFKVLGWLFALLFLYLAGWFWLNGKGAVSLLFLLLAALQTYFLLATDSIEMNRDYITRITPFSRRRIEWDEVIEIETDWNEGTLVFIGPNKRLKALGPTFWSGKDKERMLRLFSAQIETRDIDVKRRYTVIWRLNKNTRIKSKSQ